MPPRLKQPHRKTSTAQPRSFAVVSYICFHIVGLLVLAGFLLIAVIDFIRLAEDGEPSVSLLYAEIGLVFLFLLDAIVKLYDKLYVVQLSKFVLAWA